MSNYETILVEKRERVAIITINRPDKLNALNSTVHLEGIAALEELKSDDEIRVVVITGAGEKSFIAGADISEFADKLRFRSAAFFKIKLFSIQLMVSRNR